MSYKRSIPSKLARRNSVGESRGIKSTFSRPLFAVRLALDSGCIVRPFNYAILSTIAITKLSPYHGIPFYL